tara:strand:+ start:165 stop:431 length:267 start_codon:yes stop_codon:yes gene_type:complete
MTWEDELVKADQLGSHDNTVAFAQVLVEFGQLNSVEDVLRYFEKPYKWQKQYEDILTQIEIFYGKKASITEAIDNSSVRTRIEEYLNF